MTNEKKVTTVEEYRAMLAEPKDVAMPSGQVFTIRRLTPIDYIKAGLADIPNEFLRFIAEIQTGVVNTKRSAEEEKKNYETFEKFLVVTLEKGVIAPPVVFKYEESKKDTHLVFTELQIKDQEALINAIMGK